MAWTARDLDEPLKVAIIGGGFAGTSVALNLLKSFGDSPQSPEILIFEPRSELGRGLAYDTHDPVHRVNVPVGKMNVFPDDEGAFERWFFASGEHEADPGALGEDGHYYPRREAFGRHVHELVRPHVAAGNVRHIRTRAEIVRFENSRYVLSGEDGKSYLADILVVATSHPPPSPPAAFGVLSADTRFIADPTRPNALSGIGRDDRVLIVGSGLTSADVIASLEQAGHEGAITVFSRRGLRSRCHAKAAHEPLGDFTTEPARTVRELVRRVRDEVRQAASEGIGWQPVFDALRAQGGHIWRALPLVERQRLVRHIRPFWDVHRFRIAPQVHASGERLIAEGRLRYLAASLHGIDYAGPDADIGISLRHRHTGEIEEGHYDAVVITTGPAHRSIIAQQPYLQSLNGLGLIKLDDTGLGLACDRNARALDLWNAPVPGLYIAGPLARGTFGELMGLPQVSEQAALVADEIRLELGKRWSWMHAHLLKAPSPALRP